MTTRILAIDQGTTSTRAMIFDGEVSPVAVAQTEFPQHFPRSGWVEHDPEDIWRTTLQTVRDAMAQAAVSAGEIAAVGIANQRETAVVWERESGRAIHNAIVWQDRRTAPECERLRREGAAEVIAEKTGLLPDPYFSATKFAHILDSVSGARLRAERGELACGTVDSFLLSRLTGGRVFATDATNASRTMLCDIRTGEWDDELLEMLRVPRAALPEIRDNAADYGECESELFGGGMAIGAMIGDQQSAAAGQACFSPGMFKATYGTGCFALLHTGEKKAVSRNGMLSTIALQLDGRRTYALEGSIFVAGAAVQWLRDGLGLIREASQTEELARGADANQRVIFVPAFTGLGAPYWDSSARGALFGLTRGTGAAEIARAALDAVCFQTADLAGAMESDYGGAVSAMRIDGGMVANDYFAGRLADILGRVADRPLVLETTAMGAAYLAGMRAGLYPSPEDFGKRWKLDRRFTPSLPEAERADLLSAWRDAVERVKGGKFGG